MTFDSPGPDRGETYKKQDQLSDRAPQLGTSPIDLQQAQEKDQVRVAQEAESTIRDRQQAANLLAQFGAENPEAVLRGVTTSVLPQEAEKITRNTAGTPDVAGVAPQVNEGGKGVPGKATGNSTEPITGDTMLAGKEVKPPATPDKAYAEFRKTLKSIPYIGKIPEGLKNFFKPFFDFFEKLAKNSTSPEAKKYAGKFLKDNPAGLQLLEKNKIDITDRKDGGVDLKFPEKAKVIGTKLDATQVATPRNEKQDPKRIDTKENNIALIEGSAITSIVENKEGLTLTVQNKDGSRDTYVVTDMKKPEVPPAPTENQVA